LVESEKEKSKRSQMVSTPAAFDVCKRNFDAADSALQLSIVYHQEYPDDHPVVEFNTACGWTLRNQYLVEQLLIERAQLTLAQGKSDETELVRELVRAVVAKSETERWEKELAWWEEFGSRWRQVLRADESVLKKVRQRTDKAFDALDELIRGKEGTQRAGAVPMTDIDFLVRVAKEDRDMVFLRCDTDKEGSRSRFDKWASHADGRDWMYETFRSVQRSLPRDVAKKVKALDEI
jgi:hypothetical protein